LQGATHNVVGKLEVMVAIEQGNRERAADAMHAHITTVREEYELYVSDPGDFRHCQAGAPAAEA
jgi:DNA-binding GntR family transcriptional regulator